MTGRRQRRGDGLVVASLAVLVCVLGTLSGCQRAQSDADTPRQVVQGTWVLDHERPRSPSSCSPPTGPGSRPTAATACTGRGGSPLRAGSPSWPGRTSNWAAPEPRWSTLALDPSADPDVGPRDRPIGYWVLDHSSGSPHLSLRADDSFRLSDGCTARTGTWKFSTTDGQATGTLHRFER